VPRRHGRLPRGMNPHDPLPLDIYSFAQSMLPRQLTPESVSCSRVVSIDTEPRTIAEAYTERLPLVMSRLSDYTQLRNHRIYVMGRNLLHQ
jgi:hypothetical protein